MFKRINIRIYRSFIMMARKAVILGRADGSNDKTFLKEVIALPLTGYCGIKRFDNYNYVYILFYEQ